MAQIKRPLQLARRPHLALYHRDDAGLHQTARMQGQQCHSALIADPVAQGAIDPGLGIVKGHGSNAGNGVTNVGPQPHFPVFLRLYQYLNRLVPALCLNRRSALALL